MDFFDAAGAGGGNVDLMQGARALLAAIHDESHQLPPISRSLVQIEEETHALAEAAARAPATTADTYRFLAAQGIDADGLDPAAFDFTLDGAYAPGAAGAGVPAAEEWNGDVDAFLQREHMQTLIEAVRRAGDHVTQQYERAYWGDFAAEWEAAKPRLLQQLCSLSMPPSRPSAVAAALVSTGAAAPVRSRTRTPRQLAYGAVLAQLLSLRAGGQPTPQADAAAGGFRLLPRMADAAAGGGVAARALDSATLQLVGIWRLLTSMADAAASILRPGGGAGGAAVTQGAYRAGGLPLRLALLRGSLHSLGAQAAEKLRADVSAAAEEARRGGQPGTEYDAAAALRIEARGLGGAPEESARVTLPGSTGDAPLWPLLYWCLRCADFEAAMRVVRAAPPDAVPSGISALIAARCAAEAGGGGAARAVAAAQEEFWAGASAMDPHERLVYSCLAAPEPQVTLQELVPERQRTVEDWLWHKLFMALAQLSADCDTHTPTAGGYPASGPAPHDALAELQALLRDYYGEAHFNASGRTPLLYASVLLYSLQFEHALAFLAGMPDLAPEAVHLGLALHHEGLLAVSLLPRDAASPADGTFLLSAGSAPPTLLLAPLVAQHVSGWASESTDAARAALGYLWLLRADPGPRLDLAASLLLDSGRAAEALAPSPALGFIEPPALRSLILEVSSRLAGKGRVSQAARLLYQAREFGTLASLLAEELSTAVAQAGDAPATLRLATDDEPEDAAARASRLRHDADAFWKEWAASDPAAASRHGMPLSHLIRISELVDGALAWREALRGPTALGRGPAPSLPSLLAQLDSLSVDGLLPTSPATVDAANAEFRLQPPCVQRAYPALIEVSIQLLHAHFASLRSARLSAPTGGVANWVDLERVRAQAEGILSFAGSALWLAAGVLGQMGMPARAAQRLAGYLADMT